jgi:HEAT repeat protein
MLIRSTLLRSTRVGFTTARHICRHLYLVLCLPVLGCSRDSVADLVAKLKNPDVNVRRAAAAALDEQPTSDERTIEALTKSAADSDPEVRYRVTSALGKLGPVAKSAAPALRLALQDSETLVRIRAAFSLARIDPQDRSCLPVLVGAMREGDGRTLLEVGELGPQAAWAVPTLRNLLSHQSTKVRALAAKALGRIGPPAHDAMSDLQTAARDSNAAVRGAAQDALDEIRSQSRSESRK